MDAIYEEKPSVPDRLARAVVYFIIALLLAIPAIALAGVVLRLLGWMIP